MKKLPEKTHLNSLFEYKSGILLWKVRPYKSKVIVGNRAGSTGDRGYRFITVDGEPYYEHRLVYQWHFGDLANEQVDHIDGDTTNNNIENLRKATAAENNWNLRKHKDSTAAAKGVYWSTKLSKWRVRVQAHGVRYNVGHFEDLEFAELVAQEARRKYHGGFARDE